MINPINLVRYNTNFKSETSEKNKKNSEESTILPNTMSTRIRQNTQKTMSAFIDYLPKGLMGDINSNFFEFLTMGIIPYLAGSAMFMTIFNALNLGKHVGSRFGQKMALGVVFYGLLKSLSQNLVTTPVKLTTGIDIEMPYVNKVYNLPKGAGEDASMDIRWQQRKVFDSKEFFRKDLLERKDFDKIAKKLGLGENLPDSISETSPIIQSTVATTNTAKIISSYCWAATGVALATQEAWPDFIGFCKNLPKYKPAINQKFGSKILGWIKNLAKNTLCGTKEFIKTSITSCKQLWEGNTAHSGFMKHSGKALVLLSTLVTIALTTNAIARAKNMAKNTNLKTIDKNKESIEI